MRRSKYVHISYLVRYMRLTESVAGQTAVIQSLDGLSRVLCCSYPNCFLYRSLDLVSRVDMIVGTGLDLLSEAAKDQERGNRKLPHECFRPCSGIIDY